jgi:hypothetical protein
MFCMFQRGRVSVDTKYNTTGMYHVIWGGLIAFVILCSFLVAGCGKPPDSAGRPQLLGTDIATDGSPNAAVSPDARVQSIKVMTAQSNLSTYPGGLMTLTIATTPNALCSFVVEYGLGAPSKSTGIVPVAANAGGIAQWRWQVERLAHPGIWPLAITAALAGGTNVTTRVQVTVASAHISVVGSQTRLTASPTQTMVLTISTAPSIICMLLLNYGPGRPSKTLNAFANRNGIASWTWRVDRTAVSGAWPLTITAVLASGDRSYGQVTMTIL